MSFKNNEKRKGYMFCPCLLFLHHFHNQSILTYNYYMTCTILYFVMHITIKGTKYFSFLSFNIWKNEKRIGFLL